MVKIPLKELSDCESFRRSHSDAYGKLLWRTLQKGFKTKKKKINFKIRRTTAISLILTYAAQRLGMCAKNQFYVNSYLILRQICPFYFQITGSRL
jgi:hypothetical protein